MSTSELVHMVNLILEVHISPSSFEIAVTKFIHKHKHKVTHKHNFCMRKVRTELIM